VISSPSGAGAASEGVFVLDDDMARDALPKPRPTEVLPTIEDADRTKKASAILLVVPRAAVA